MAWNALWTILGVMMVFLALGVPISYSIGISSLAAIRKIFAINTAKHLDIEPTVSLDDLK